ncbi:hypothetical protein IFM89_015611 [Coptis chinensis]|uniref:Helicase-like transcription factor CHR28 n=1 Tax=Coptis chinensis TaxID=261450 RepID=A0A835M3H1_9MAGN|nr:hypothetical protein IFM89_015611 [Coptis chinensis]
MLMAEDSNNNNNNSNNDNIIYNDEIPFEFGDDMDDTIDMDSFMRILSEDDSSNPHLLSRSEDLSCNNLSQGGVAPGEVNYWSQSGLQSGVHESEEAPPTECGLLESTQWSHSGNMILSNPMAQTGSEEMFEFPELSGKIFDEGEVDSVSSPLRTCSVSLTDWSTMSCVENDTCSSRERDGVGMNAPLYNFDRTFTPTHVPSCNATFNFASGDSSGSTDHVNLVDLKNEEENEFRHTGGVSHSQCASHFPVVEESDLAFRSHTDLFGNGFENPGALERSLPTLNAEIAFIDSETCLVHPHLTEINGSQVSDIHFEGNEIYSEQSSCGRSTTFSDGTVTDSSKKTPHYFSFPFMEIKEENMTCQEDLVEDQILSSQTICTTTNTYLEEEAKPQISLSTKASVVDCSNRSISQGSSFKHEASSHCLPTGIGSSRHASKNLLPGFPSFIPMKKELVCVDDDRMGEVHASKSACFRSATLEGYCSDEAPSHSVPDTQSVFLPGPNVPIKEEKKTEVVPHRYTDYHVKVNGVIKGNHSVDRSNVDDEADVCILEDISDPRTQPLGRVHEKSPITAQRVVYDPLYHIGIGNTRVKAFDERITLRVALQRIALSWMVQKETASLHCSGGILADDQGLGKTISTIALILKERPPSSKATSVTVKQNEPKALNLDDDEDSESLQLNGMKIKSENASMLAKGRPAAGTLVVCPTSVLRQWSDELHSKVSKEANLSVLVYHGSNRTKDPFELAKYDVVVTTYSIVSMEVPKQPLVDKDDDEKGQPEGHGLESMEFSYNKKRKYPPSADKKSRKSKKSLDSTLLESITRPLARVGWFRVVLDEAQSIKNHRTQVARACWGLRAKRRWCLSGTPIQNAIDDLYSYFRFLRYDPYAAYKSFCSMIKVPISRNPTNGYKKLQAVLKTIMLRRTKGSLLDGEPIINLPPKSVELKRVDFSMEERGFYSKLEADSRDQFKVYAAAGTVKQNYVNILLMLLRLRQACDHPLLVKGYDSNSVLRSSVEKAKELAGEKQLELLNCLEARSDICGICNDPPEDAVVTICGHVFCNQCILEHLTGDENLCPAAQCKVHLNITSVFSRNALRSSLFGQTNLENHASQPDETLVACSKGPSDSSKIKAALEVLQSLSKPWHYTSKDSTISSINEVGPCPVNASDPHIEDRRHDIETGSNDSIVKVSEKAIVFSQWTRMLDLLEVHLKTSSIQYRRLDGTMSVVARDKAVKDFNAIPEVTVMIMSLKAASLGLNMVAACHVILLDLWWNPTTEDQAIDRAHRIGQTRPVTVLRLTVKDTVEDRILALQPLKLDRELERVYDPATGVSYQRSVAGHCLLYVVYICSKSKKTIFLLDFVDFSVLLAIMEKGPCVLGGVLKTVGKRGWIPSVKSHEQKKREMVASAFGEDETGSRQTRLTVDDLKYLFMA